MRPGKSCPVFLRDPVNWVVLFVLFFLSWWCSSGYTGLPNLVWGGIWFVFLWSYVFEVSGTSGFIFIWGSCVCVLRFIRDVPSCGVGVFCISVGF